MVTKTNDKAPAGNVGSQATETALAAPLGNAGASPSPAGAETVVEQPKPIEAVPGSIDLAKASTEDTTRAMAAAAQDEVKHAEIVEAEKGQAAAAEISGTLPASATAPAADTYLGVPMADLAAQPVAPAPGPASVGAIDETDPGVPAPAVTPTATTKTGHVFSGEIATLWHKLKEGATEQELRLTTGIHDVMSHVRRFERDAIARITSRSTADGIVYQAKEQGEA
jgi:hypothetical protein